MHKRLGYWVLFVCTLLSCIQNYTKQEPQNNNTPNTQSTSNHIAHTSHSVRASQPAIPTTPFEHVTHLSEPPVNKSIRFTKIKDMTREQAYKARLYYLWDENIEVAIKAIERILTLEDDQDNITQLMLELAHLHYAQQNYTAAQEIYDTFINLYPGNKYLEYAYYQALRCHYGNMLDQHHDQSETRATISCAQSYLDAFGTNGHYTEEVRNIRENAYLTLCLSELDRYDFYINKYTYTTQASSLRAAYYRLESLYEQLPYIAKHLYDACAPAVAQALRNISIEELDDNKQDKMDTTHRELSQVSTQLHEILEGTNKQKHRNPKRKSIIYRF